MPWADQAEDKETQECGTARAGPDRPQEKLSMVKPLCWTTGGAPRVLSRREGPVGNEAAQAEGLGKPTNAS